MSDQLTLSREQVRSIDRIAIEEFGIPGIILMENAGRGCADLLIEKGISPSSPVVICCGKGNNAGDGFVMARHLEVLGYPVKILMFCHPDELKGDAQINYDIIRKAGIPIHQLLLPEDEHQLKKHLEHSSWIVDALLGTGCTGQLRPPFNYVINEINAAGRPVFSIDIPSGLDCDLGNSVDCCIHAKVTAAIVATKPGFQTPTGKKVTGEVHVIEIGIPQTIISRIHGDQT